MQPLSFGSQGEHCKSHALLLLLFSCWLPIVWGSCPTAAQLRSLVKQLDAHSIRCFCSEDPLPGGWEVTCIRDAVSIPSVAAEKSPGHDMYSVNASPLSFSVKLMSANTIELTCDESVPDFKPAMFQGFNVDAVDTFRLFNCPLPAVPLSVILHRTSVTRLHLREESSNSSQVDEEIASEVKSLRIEFSEPRNFTANHMKNVFNGLDDLEKLSLHNVQIEVEAENSSPTLTAPATIFYARPKRAAANHTSPSPSAFNPTKQYISSTAVFATITDDPVSLTSSTQSFSTSVQSFTSTALPEITTVGDVMRRMALPPSSSSSPFQTTLVASPSTRSVSQTEPPADKESRPSIGDAGSRILLAHKPPTVTQRSTNLGLNLNNLLPKLKNILIDAMFPAHLSPSSGLILERMTRELKNLESVQLRNNHIAELNEFTFAGSAPRLRRLYLIGNGIQVLHPRIFSNLVNLQVLDLFNNNLTELPGGLFNGLTSITTLRIGKNKFSSLAENLLWPMKGLKAIDLNQNRNLKFLPHRFLAGSVELQNLSLTDCDLDQLSTDSSSFFASAPSLERIELRGNHLRNLTAPGLFARNPSLRKIDFSYNSIVSISPDVFSSNSSSLIELNLHANELTTIDSTALSQLKNLRYLKLGFNNITTLAPDLLFALRKLEDLDLSRNRLSTVNPQRSRLPFGLGSVHLRKLNFSRNNISDFSEFSVIDWSLYLKITEIDLSRNQLHGPVLLPVFYSTAPHVILDLSANEIQSVQMNDILQYEAGVLQAARDGRLSDSLEERNSWKSSSLTSITQVIIRLDKNPLHCDCRLEPFLTYANASSRDLEAAFRGILNRVSFDFFSPSLRCHQPPNLADVPLHKVDPWNLTCLLEDTRVCPHECVCLYRSYDRHAFINCENRNLEIIPEDILLPSRYKNVSLSELGSEDRLSVRTVSLLLSNNGITEVDNLHRLISGQEAELLSGEGIYFEIYLDNNLIESIPGNLFQHKKGKEQESDEESSAGGDLSAVRVLSLRNNHLQRIPIQFLESIRASSASPGNRSDPSVRLFLGSNPFNCSSQESSSLPADINNCGLIFFKSWLTKNYDVVQDVKQVTCNALRNTRDPESRQAIVEIPDSDLCPQLLLSNEGGFLALAVLCLLFSIVTLILCILYYRNKQTFLAFVYIHVQPVFVCLNFSEDDLDEDKLYDAFLSYSSSDRDIVMEMIEKLERPSDVSQHSISFLKQQSGIPSIHEGNSDQIVPEHAINAKKTSSGKEVSGDDGNYFTLCIHERDWLPGNLISWNIVNSVQNSRRTILILSKEFIRSIWFQVEFHTAYYQMLEDKMDRLIVVVRDELPPKEEMDQDLVFLLTTKTYLTWGEKWFWEKLRYALPHRKQGPKALPAKLPELKEKGNLSMTMNSKAKQSKANLMKEYVDQTISDHFQLQQKTAVGVSIDMNNRHHQSSKSSSKRGHVNQSFVSESEA